MTLMFIGRKVRFCVLLLSKVVYSSCAGECHLGFLSVGVYDVGLSLVMSGVRLSLG